MARRYTTNEFIDKINKLFPDNFTFEKTDYKGNKKDIILTCKKHGDIITTPAMLFKGYGCWKCENRKHFITYDEFVEKSKEIYGDKYKITSEQFNNKNSDQQIEINCPIHGIFLQRIENFLNGYGCKECRKEEIIREKNNLLDKEVKERYGNMYGASLSEIDARKAVITCKLHGKFTLWKHHIFDKKCICPQCMKDASTNDNYENFIKKATELYGDRYIYTNVRYINNHTKVDIICPEHGIYRVTPNDHITKHSGCPLCCNNVSTPERLISKFIEDNGFAISCNERQIIQPKELDIYIPSERLAIEYNGLRWHSELFKEDPINCHLAKTNECKEKGIRLIHIFEDEWLERSQIVKSMLRNILGKTNNRLYARQCDIRNVDAKTAMQFLDDNHIQGRCKAKYHYGLYHEGELVSLMTFGKTRQQKKYNEDYDNTWELLRFCNKLNTSVVGGASKLLKHFIGEVKPHRIVTYADKRWSVGNLYERLGFVHTHDSKPNYFYVVGQHRENRFKYRKGELVKQGFDPSKSEHEIMYERGIPRIYDCGTMAFEMTID